MWQEKPSNLSAWQTDQHSLHFLSFMTNDGLTLVTPRVTPVLDQNFRPASLTNRAFRREVEATGGGERVVIALEQTDGSVFHFKTRIFRADRAESAGNFRYIERFIKFLLWSRGGYKVYFDGAADVHSRLVPHS